MIYDIPNAEFEDTFTTLKDLISLNPEHISAYTYSFDTDYMEDKQDDSTDFMIVRERLIDAGYNKYEISNFAKPGHESDIILTTGSLETTTGWGGLLHGRWKISL